MNSQKSIDCLVKETNFYVSNVSKTLNKQWRQPNTYWHEQFVFVWANLCYLTIPNRHRWTARYERGWNYMKHTVEKTNGRGSEPVPAKSYQHLNERYPVILQINLNVPDHSDQTSKSWRFPKNAWLAHFYNNCGRGRYHLHPNGINATALCRFFNQWQTQLHFSSSGLTMIPQIMERLLAWLF